MPLLARHDYAWLGCWCLHSLKQASFSHLDFPQDDAADIASLQVVGLSVHNQVQQSQLVVCLDVHLVQEICWLTKNLSEALDGLWESLQTSVEQPTIVVIRQYFNRQGTSHAARDWMVDDHDGVLEALRFEAELGELSVETTDFLLRCGAHPDSSHDGCNALDWSLPLNEIGGVQPRD